MSHDPPTITTHDGRRRLACAPVALVALIVNEREELLMLSHPNSSGRWETVNGALEHGETLLDGCLREIHEEAGPDIQVRPLGVVHTFSFAFDANIRHMISLCYLFAYEGGEVMPGDDMAGSRSRWVSVDEIERGAVDVIVPSQVPWLFARTVELYRDLKDRPPAEQQPPLESAPRWKYPKQYTAPRNFDTRDDLRIRPATAADEPLLWDVLYHAIHVGEGEPLPPRDIVQQPALAQYVSGWGRADDLGVVAEDAASGEPVGAAWLRRWPGDERGYGYVDAATPELTIAVLPGHRGRGAGSRLMAALIDTAREQYRALSLSVSPDNPARRLYERLGFVVVGERDGSLVMRLALDERD